MRKVQDYIEEIETRVCLMGDEDFNDDELERVMQVVYAKYNAARDTAELNRPDNYAHQGEADILNRAGRMGGRKNLVPRSDGKGKDIQYEIS
jgi:hypothetical protein